MHEQKIVLRYVVEMLAGFFLYGVVLVVSINVGRPMPAGIGRTLLLVSPMVPFLLIVGAIVRGCGVWTNTYGCRHWRTS